MIYVGDKPVLEVVTNWCKFRSVIKKTILETKRAQAKKKLNDSGFYIYIYTALYMYRQVFAI